MSIGRISMLVLAAGAALTAAGPVLAADLGNNAYGSMKDDAAYPVLWQGRYFGVTVGATGMGADIKGFGTRDEADIDGGSFTGGVLVGYNFRSGNWVGGFEADMSVSGIDEEKKVNGLGTVSLSSSVFGSARVRGGYVWDRVFMYATAGLAVYDLDMKSSLGGNEDTAWMSPVVGVGAEYALNNDWTMRLEGRATGGSGEFTLAGAKRDVDFGESTLRVGLTRRF